MSDKKNQGWHSDSGIVYKSIETSLFTVKTTGKNCKQMQCSAIKKQTAINIKIQLSGRRSNKTHSEKQFRMNKNILLNNLRNCQACPRN